ncbi:MAG: lactate utilization protein [Patescibacteria group bacterium]
MNYETVPPKKIIEKTAQAIRERGVEVFVVSNKKAALEKIKSLISKNQTVMNGSSTTLDEIGFTEYLKSGSHKWQNLHESIMKEPDQQKGLLMRRQALLADYFLGSVNAIAQTGELVAADAYGSRVGAYPFAAGHVVLVAGAQKVVPTLAKAIKRVRDYVLPLESERVKKAYGMPGSMVGKMFILEKEMFPKRTYLVLVEEKLGY